MKFEQPNYEEEMPFPMDDFEEENKNAPKSDGCPLPDFGFYRSAREAKKAKDQLKFLPKQYDADGEEINPVIKPTGLDMIHGIFYARFLPEKGIRIVHQSPPGCIVAQDGVQTPPLVDFTAVSEFIIPRQIFCNRYMTVLSPCGQYRILGFPTCINSPIYERNELIFNFGIVCSSKYDNLPYEAVVRRLASTFTEMEIQNGYLRKEGVLEHVDRRSIRDLLEIVREDLNNYNECMIPVDDANTINMKLFPVLKNPPPVKSWHVPIAKVKLDAIVDDRWDLTLKKIITYIDGVNDVRRISIKADVSLDLTKTALQHLLYYKTILILDIFFFSNIYCVKPGIEDFVKNKDGIQTECLNYVSTGTKRVSEFQLCKLYTTLFPGRTLREWLTYHMDFGLYIMQNIDVRRFIQFGVIKGFVSRIQKYVVSQQYLAQLVTGEMLMKEGGDFIQRYTDGCHSFDQIIVENDLTDAMIMKELAKLPSHDIQVLYR